MASGHYGIICILAVFGQIAASQSEMMAEVEQRLADYFVGHPPTDE